MLTEVIGKKIKLKEHKNQLEFTQVNLPSYTI